MLSDEIERKLTPKEELLAEDRLVLETVPFATILTNVEIGVPFEHKSSGRR